MLRRICSSATSAASTDPTRTTETPKPASKEHSADDRTDRPGRLRGLVPDGKPASVRGGDAPPGGGAVARHRHPALRSTVHPGPARLEAGPDRSRRDPPSP